MKFKLTSLISFLMLISLQIFAQNPIYTKQDSLNNYFLDIKETSTGDFIATSGSFTQNPTLSLYNYTTTIYKINTSGQLLNTYALPPNYSAQGIYYYNNFYFVTGIQQNTTNISNPQNYLKVLKLNSNFQEVQSKIFDSIDAINYKEFYSTKATIVNNQLYFLSAKIGINGIRLIKTDINLNIKASKTFAPNSNIFTNLSAVGNKVYATAWDIQNTGFGSKLQIGAFDTLLNLTTILNLDSITYKQVGVIPNSCTQPKVFMFPNASIVPVSNCKYVVSGHGKVIYAYNPIGTCPDDNQNIICTVDAVSNQITNYNIFGKINGYNELFYFGTGGVSIKYGNVYSVLLSGKGVNSGAIPQNKNCQIFVNKTDSLSNLIWDKYIGDTMFFYAPISVFATSDSGLVISGMRYNYISPVKSNVGEGFVMKLDKNGNQVFVGLKQNDNNYVEHKCHPNPAKDNIRFELPFVTTYKLEVFDLLGKNIFSDNNYTNQSDLSLENYVVGTYIYKISYKEKVFTGKFIKK
jgi:hypothetical protein